MSPYFNYEAPQFRVPSVPSFMEQIAPYLQGIEDCKRKGMTVRQIAVLLQEQGVHSPYGFEYGRDRPDYEERERTRVMGLLRFHCFKGVHTPDTPREQARLARQKVICARMRMIVAGYALKGRGMVIDMGGPTNVWLEWTPQMQDAEYEMTYYAHRSIVMPCPSQPASSMS